LRANGVEAPLTRASSEGLDEARRPARVRSLHARDMGAETPERVSA
jgi:hypothetical protein